MQLSKSFNNAVNAYVMKSCFCKDGRGSWIFRLTSAIYGRAKHVKIPKMFLLRSSHNKYYETKHLHVSIKGFKCHILCNASASRRWILREIYNDKHRDLMEQLRSQCRVAVKLFNLSNFMNYLFFCLRA